MPVNASISPSIAPSTVSIITVAIPPRTSSNNSNSGLRDSNEPPRFSNAPFKFSIVSENPILSANCDIDSFASSNLSFTSAIVFSTPPNAATIAAITPTTTSITATTGPIEDARAANPPPPAAAPPPPARASIFVDNSPSLAIMAV